ncbi:MAG TPA: 3'-5' exonuclease [Cytophagaceae bacterium]|jgi:hypothetical protein
MDFFKKLKNILFIDIETVPCAESYDKLSSRLQPLWDKKANFIDKGASAKNIFDDKAGIYAEFGKVVTIALGFFYKQDEKLCFKVKSFTNRDEQIVLREFKEMTDRLENKNHLLCAHNGKEFDFPFLCRRLLVNCIELPKILQLRGKKPWEVMHYDTLEMWKFGDKKNFTSLDLLAALFDVPTSKDELDGSMVRDTYYKHNDLEKIARYCERDVVLTAQIFLKYHCQPVIDKESIYII